MPLIKTTLETDIRALMATLATNTDAQDAQEKFIKGLVQAVDAYLRTALVTVTTAQGPGTGQLS